MLRPGIRELAISMKINITEWLTFVGHERAVARSRECHTMTALQDIVVVLDGSAASETRLAVALALARQHNAHLTGLSALALLMLARPAAHPRSYPERDMPLAPSALDLSEVTTEKAERIEAAFRQRLRLSGVQGDWRLVSDRISEAVAHHARHADLIILGQLDPNHPPLPASRQLLEDVLLTSGRPILVIPYIGRVETFGTNILIAWNNSREAARAVHDAIPLLAKATSITILAVTPGGRKAPTDDAALADLILHLARHGISATAAQTVAVDTSVSDALLSYASDVNADVLVAGSYGHSRMRKWTLGSTTLNLLQRLTLPALMSH
jgi:nucleotide-binding universal stress UspA family protein